MFERKTQICVFLENKPGRFAEVCDLLYANGINIRAMNVMPSVDYGVMRMVVNDSQKAIAALEQERVPFLESDVLAVEVADRPGIAATLGRRLADAGVNIEYTYFSGASSGSRALMIFMVSDLDTALAAMQESQID
jgi:hypothetical protein